MKLRSLSLALFVLVFVSGCEQAANEDGYAHSEVSADELLGFISQVKGSLVFVEGGEFLMGDYGAQHSPERLPYDGGKDSKPLHGVKLTSYSIDKFKVRNKDYQFYLRFHGLNLRQDVGGGGKYALTSVPPDNPAHMDWYEANQYCNWLADVSGLPFSLPTEAQWEYAARSRGKFMIVATDDGTYKAVRHVVEANGRTDIKGVNISGPWDRKLFAEQMGWNTGGLTPLPVDSFPPNPLGLYAMSDNGQEWVKDWYDPDYYKYSPENDPQGPDGPVHKDKFGRDTKVLRGQEYADPVWGGAANIYRTPAEPHGYVSDDETPYLNANTARCAVNSSAPIK
ncbi:formylglycine-generating enzyme family protein [Pseudomonas fluorescens]|uniref:formylglycine-generating enzyme family protein n=1 Tax=Pseudomonas fluorescens TaxID=294 RepID=UPI00177AF28D|nr:SUMF1/EgtB/PvdO family nonheme iron enzyme [Pseudomonas fluorescens]